MSHVEVTSPRDSPTPDACPECDTTASVTSDLHKYQVACTCKPGSVQYACAEEPGPPAQAKVDTPPALPPRPAPGALATHRRNNAPNTCSTSEPVTCRRRKYAWWCVGCGALAAALGGLLAAQHILLRAYTASPRRLETVPAAVPAAMLVLTGVCIMSLARRRNRYSYMIKVAGACCLVCAVTCVLVTITTTVIHMNRLQTLKFCEFTQRTQTCTCFSMPPDAQHDNENEARCVFEGVTSCSVVHGALYWCLRGVFALSVCAVLACAAGAALAHQLLSHERKKMYWEQLELRCRSLYRPPAGQSSAAVRTAQQQSCSCCTACRQPSQPGGGWESHRFWSPPGRVGNLYSPNPGTGRKASAWSWFPWPRSHSQNSRSCRGPPQSGDSAYGFCETDNPQAVNNPGGAGYEEHGYPSAGGAGGGVGGGGVVAGYSGARGYNAQAFGMAGGFGQGQGYVEGASFDAATGVWGPPPPYSPQGRSNSRHHLHQDPATATLLHHHHIDVHRNSALIHDHANLQSQLAMQTSHCPRNSSYIGHLMHPNVHMSELALNPDLARLNPELAHLNPEIVHVNPDLAHLNPEIVRVNPELVRLNPELARLNQVFPTDMNELARIQAEIVRMGSGSRFNTLRGRLVAYPACQRSLGTSLGNLHRDCRLPDENMTIECMHQKSNSKVSDQSTSTDSCQKQGKENMAFQNDKHCGGRRECLRNPNAESEVYFADGSSCCNVSLKADCCMNRNVSALVGTIENQLESTSESETGSFTLTRQQRPQPQAVGSKRRPRAQNADKHNKIQEKIRQELNNSIRLAENQIEQLNNSMCQRLNESRMSERMNDSKLSDRMNESRVSDTRMNDSRSDHSRLNDSSRVGDFSRINDMRMSDHSRMNESIQRLEERRMSDQHSRKEIEKSSPKIRAHMSPLRKRTSPKTVKRESPLHPRQSSSDSNVSHKNPEFFVPPPPAHSPLSPNTEESLLSEDDERQTVYTNDKPETSKCLGPDSQYEPVREEKEPVKVNHHHCYSDTNTMDSGWQSGSEKHVTD